MPIGHTRALIAAALTGALDNVECEADPVFNIDVPVSCPGVSSEVLQPRKTWNNASDYDSQAAELAAMFAKNFASFTESASAEVVAAGPRTS